jgi:hypothetical protein
MTEAPQPSLPLEDQTPKLDPQDAIHAKVLALDEMSLHLRRAELKDRQDLSLDELTELCAILAQLRRKKSGPPSGGGKTKKSIKTPPKVDIKALKF